MDIINEIKGMTKRLAIVLIVITAVIAACSCGIGTLIGSSGNGHPAANATQAPTAHHATSTPKAPTATPKPKTWNIVDTFTGNGNSQTGDFTVANPNFRIVWSCNPASFDGSSYNLIVDVDSTDPSQLGDPAAINTICQAGNSTGATNIHDLSGTMYLNVTSEGSWVMRVEVFE